MSREEVLQYLIATVPDAPWQFLAGSLYKQEERAALENVTKYLFPKTTRYDGWVSGVESP